MASNVSIANRALTKLGATRILSLTDASAQARTISSMFEDVRDAEIRRYRWKFATTRVQLNALVAAPDWGYQYQYPLPADFLHLIQVNEFYVRTGKWRAPWSVERGNILCDFTAPLKIRYTAKITDPAKFDPLFVEMFACKLAWEACEQITQSSTKKQQIQEEYKFARDEAVRQDAIENPPDEIPWGSWLDSREGETVWPYGDDGGPGASGFVVL